MGVEEEQGKCYLGNLAELHVVNHSTISAFFNDSIRVLWPDQILYENILVVTTDAAPYMCKAMRALQILFPKMVHITCLAHGLHRIAELVRSTYLEVNRLISTTKSIFIKAPHRTHLFRELCPNVPLPPSPIITRWGTWLEAARYYAEHFENLNKVVMALDETEALSIQECRELVSDVGAKHSLTFTTSNFSILPTTIAKFETRVWELKTAVHLMEDIGKEMANLYDFIKWNDILRENVGFGTLREINQLLTGETEKPQNELIKRLSCTELASFVYAPVVSCDVQRVFSMYKTVLADNRRSFLFENLKQHLIVKCNESIL